MTARCMVSDVEYCSEYHAVENHHHLPYRSFRISLIKLDVTRKGANWWQRIWRRLKRGHRRTIYASHTFSSMQCTGRTNFALNLHEYSQKVDGNRLPPAGNGYQLEVEMRRVVSQRFEFITPFRRAFRSASFSITYK